MRYIELRNIDLNPNARLGIDQEQVRFLQLFLTYMLWTEEKEAADQWVEEGTRKNEIVSLEHPLNQTEFIEEGRYLLTDMKKMALELEQLEALPLIEKMLEELERPSETLAGTIYQAAKESSQHQFATSLGLSYYQKAHERPYQLAGFRDGVVYANLVI